MRDFDESEILKQVSVMDRRAKSAFAAASAERLLPFAAGIHGDHRSGEAARMRAALNRLWSCIEGGEVDLTDDLRDVEALDLPEDETVDFVAQDAVYALCYALETWLNDDPVAAVHAARQSYAAADLLAQESGGDIREYSASVRDKLRNSDIVQKALAALADDLDALRAQNFDAALLRSRAALSLG